MEFAPLDFDNKPKDFSSFRSELEKDLEKFATNGNGLLDVRQLSVDILNSDEEVLEEHDYQGEDL